MTFQESIKKTKLARWEKLALFVLVLLFANMFAGGMLSPSSPRDGQPETKTGHQSIRPDAFEYSPATPHTQTAPCSRGYGSVCPMTASK